MALVYHDCMDLKEAQIWAGVYKVVPEADLACGEYCFYYAANVTNIGIAGGKIFGFSVK